MATKTRGEATAVHELMDDPRYAARFQNLDRLKTRRKEVLERQLDLEKPFIGESSEAVYIPDPTAVDRRVAELLEREIPPAGDLFASIAKCKFEALALDRAILQGSADLEQLGRSIGQSILHNDRKVLFDASIGVLEAINGLALAVTHYRAIEQDFVRCGALPGASQGSGPLAWILAKESVWGWGVNAFRLLRTFRDLMLHAAAFEWRDERPFQKTCDEFLEDWQPPEGL